MIEPIIYYAQELDNPATIFLKKEETKAARSRKAVTDARLFDTRHWRSITDISLTLKQAFHSKIGHWARPETRAWTNIDEFQCRRTFRSFMRLLNKAVYKTAFKRHGTRLKVIPILEKQAEGRWHYHAAIEPPKHLTAEAFEALIRECWHKTGWGYHENIIRSNADEGWVNYMLKARQKSGLETWADSIDWENLHNPTADD